MSGHIHASFIQFVITMLYVVIGMFFIKIFTVKYSDTMLAKALGFILD